MGRRWAELEACLYFPAVDGGIRTKDKVGLVFLLSPYDTTPKKDTATSSCGFCMAMTGFSCSADVAAHMCPSKKHTIAAGETRSRVVNLHIRAVLDFA